ncbi:MAG TPA: hypothetical protein VFE37_25415 [Chloroflexota bacterium]|nr:hypothetical protein [Chloroflexota bacterium]
MRHWAERRALAAYGWDADGEAELEAPASATRPHRERRHAWVPLGILGSGLALLLYSMQLGSLTTSGYDLQRLHGERDEWRQRNEQLELELAKVQSLAWIEVEAVNRLGMQKAQHVTYLEVSPSAAAAPDQGLSAAVPAPPAEPAAHSPFGAVLALWRGLLAQLVPPIDAGP